MSDFLEQLQPSASMTITKRAKELKQKGEQVYTFSIGDTHFNPPDAINNRIWEGLHYGHTHYTEAQGLLEFRKEIANFYDRIYHSEEILITAGLKEGLYFVLMALEGNRICVLEPSWLGYKAITILNNKTYIPINRYNSYWLDELQNTDFDVFIVCSPNNPDGAIIDNLTAREIKHIVDQKNAYIIIDEIYKEFDYTVDKLSCDLGKVFYGAPNAIIGNGLSKAFAMTGARIGYMLIKDQDLMNRLLRIQQNVTTSANSIGQYAGVGMSNALDEVKDFVNYYHVNRDLVEKTLPNFEHYIPQGGFYYFVNIADFGLNDATSFCRKLLDEQHVALVPGSAYGESFDSYVRLSFSVDRNYLVEGLKDLEKVFTKKT